jgi:hypothetical protein
MVTTYRRLTTGLYNTVSYYNAVVGIYTVMCLTVQNTDNLNLLKQL